MKRLFYILAVVLTGCSSAPKQVLVDFDVKRLSPLIYEFTNLSTGCDSYRWDFGDGSWATGTDAMYAFQSTGTYIVTLTAEADGIKYERRQTVNVSKPHVYIYGYRIYHIPYENRYYRASFKDDSLLPSSWDFYTNYTPLLDESYLPYTYIFNYPRELENMDNHDYYSVQVYRNTTTTNTSNDVSCMKQKLMVKDLKTYLPEYVLSTASDATTIGVLMEYDYD